MGSVTFDGYWTVANAGEQSAYNLLTWVPGPFTITFDGDTLGLSSPVNDFSLFYQAYVNDNGQLSMLVTDSEFGGTAFLYSSDPNLFAHEKVVVQSSNWTCLLAGTLIATPGGERAVEDLRPGDPVLTPEGEEVAIRWIGRQSAITMLAGPEAVPVLIRAGALADGIPTQDLCVSPDHAILVDGVLANARALNNGITILPMPQPPAQIDYYHLELDRHRLILANGAPVESFVDDVSRSTFDNVDDWYARGLEPLAGEALPYVKAKSARQLPRATAGRLADRAVALQVSASL
jgi:hypothetical protein